MSHIHIPDGVLPIGWWLVGYLVAIGILVIALQKLEKRDLRKRVPYLGVISALMLITMSVPVGVLPFHINLTILTGVLAGPWLGYVSVFMVNFILSFLGHGGITVVGINTLILGSEVFIGWGIFRLLRRWVKELPAVGVGTVLALLISTTLMMGVVGFSQLDWGYALPHEDHEHSEREEIHLVDGNEPAIMEDEHIHENKHVGEVDQSEEAAGHIPIGEELTTVSEGHSNQGGEVTSFKDKLAEVSFFKLSGLGALLAILIIGIGLEVMVTVLMVSFFKKVRPDLLS